MLKKTSRTDAVSKKASDLWSGASDTLEQAGETMRPAVQDAVAATAEKASTAAAAARPHVQAAAEAAQPHLDRLKQAAQPRLDSVLEAAQQQTRAPRARLRDSVQQAAGAAADAGYSAYAALPEQAQQAVEQVAPKVAKRKRKGKLLIMTGLLLGGIAAYLIYQDRKAKAATAEPISPAPAPAPAPEAPAEPSSGDDLVGDVGRRADEEVTGSARGRHAAGED